jgi:hypothetical protein
MTTTRRGAGELSGDDDMLPKLTGIGDTRHLESNEPTRSTEQGHCR